MEKNYHDALSPVFITEVKALLTKYEELIIQSILSRSAGKVLYRLVKTPTEIDTALSPNLEGPWLYKPQSLIRIYQAVELLGDCMVLRDNGWLGYTDAIYYSPRRAIPLLEGLVRDKDGELRLGAY